MFFYCRKTIYKIEKRKRREIKKDADAKKCKRVKEGYISLKKYNLCVAIILILRKYLSLSAQFDRANDERRYTCITRTPQNMPRVYAFSWLSSAFRVRRELFSELSNFAEPRITHSSYSNILSRIKDPGISRARTRNIDPGPWRVERSSTNWAANPVDSHSSGFLIVDNAEYNPRFSRFHENISIIPYDATKFAYSHLFRKIKM